MNLNEFEWSFVILGIRWYLVSVSGRMPNGSTSVKKLPVDKIDSLWARCRFFLYFHRRPHSRRSRSHSTPYGQSASDTPPTPPHSRRSQDDIIFLDLYRSSTAWDGVRATEMCPTELASLGRGCIKSGKNTQGLSSASIERYHPSLLEQCPVAHQCVHPYPHRQHPLDYT